MKLRNITAGVITFALITAWNNQLLQDWLKTAGRTGSPLLTSESDGADGASVVSNPHGLNWQAVRSTKVVETADGGFDLQFDEAVSAAEGERIALSGVGFVLKSGVRQNLKGEDEVAEFLLLPGDGGVAWCCGLSAIPRAEFSVLVECRDAAFAKTRADPKSGSFFVQATGTLELRSENTYNAFYTLADADIEFLDITAVLPPNVMNPCRNEPMLPAD